MATKIAQSQLAELPERVGILETKVENINEKIGEVKEDIKEMHDCLDRTRDSVMEKLSEMTNEYRTNATKYYEHANTLNQQQTEQHHELAGKISELEKIKTKYTMYALALIAFFAGTGLVHAVNLPTIIKFLGL